MSAPIEAFVMRSVCVCKRGSGECHFILQLDQQRAGRERTC
jgi:hypothetical protein